MESLNTPRKHAPFDRAERILLENEDVGVRLDSLAAKTNYRRKLRRARSLNAAQDLNCCLAFFQIRRVLSKTIHANSHNFKQLSRPSSCSSAAYPPSPHSPHSSLSSSALRKIGIW